MLRVGRERLTRMDVQGRRRKGRPKQRWMDSQCKCGLEGEGTVGRGDTKPGCMKATCRIHRPYIEVGKDAVEEDLQTHENMFK